MEFYVHITVGYDRTGEEKKVQIDSFRIPEMGNPLVRIKKKVFQLLEGKVFNVWLVS